MEQKETKFLQVATSLYIMVLLEDIARVKSILKSIDTKAEVVVTGYVFEVQNIEKEGSGINLLAKLLSGKLGISVGYKQSYENFITVNAGNLDAMFELFLIVLGCQQSDIKSKIRLKR